ncbi:hypothetical protein DIPPA_12045 [Diplonema papillatum]|nr:hypothetical protein DIPPA_12045 [Diplonema papillatum]
MDVNDGDELGGLEDSLRMVEEGIAAELREAGGGSAGGWSAASGDDDVEPDDTDEEAGDDLHEATEIYTELPQYGAAEEKLEALRAVAENALASAGEQHATEGFVRGVFESAVGGPFLNAACADFCAAGCGLPLRSTVAWVVDRLARHGGLGEKEKDVLWQAGVARLLSVEVSRALRVKRQANAIEGAAYDTMAKLAGVACVLCDGRLERIVAATHDFGLFEAACQMLAILDQRSAPDSFASQTFRVAALSLEYAENALSFAARPVSSVLPTLFTGASTTATLLRLVQPRTPAPALAIARLYYNAISAVAHETAPRVTLPRFARSPASFHVLSLIVGSFGECLGKGDFEAHRTEEATSAQACSDAVKCLALIASGVEGWKLLAEAHATAWSGVVDCFVAVHMEEGKEGAGPQRKATLWRLEQAFLKLFSAVMRFGDACEEANPDSDTEHSDENAGVFGPRYGTVIETLACGVTRLLKGAKDSAFSSHASSTIELLRCYSKRSHRLVARGLTTAASLYLPSSEAPSSLSEQPVGFLPAVCLLLSHFPLNKTAANGNLAALHLRSIVRQLARTSPAFASCETYRDEAAKLSSLSPAERFVVEYRADRLEEAAIEDIAARSIQKAWRGCLGRRAFAAARVVYEGHIAKRRALDSERLVGCDEIEAEELRERRTEQAVFEVEWAVVLERHRRVVASREEFDEELTYRLDSLRRDFFASSGMQAEAESLQIKHEAALARVNSTEAEELAGYRDEIDDLRTACTHRKAGANEAQSPVNEEEESFRERLRHLEDDVVPKATSKFAKARVQIRAEHAREKAKIEQALEAAFEPVAGGFGERALTRHVELEEERARGLGLWGRGAWWGNRGLEESQKQEWQRLVVRMTLEWLEHEAEQTLRSYVVEHAAMVSSTSLSASLAMLTFLTASLEAREHTARFALTASEPLHFITAEEQKLFVTDIAIPSRAFHRDYIIARESATRSEMQPEMLRAVQELVEKANITVWANLKRKLLSEEEDSRFVVVADWREEVHVQWGEWVAGGSEDMVASLIGAEEMERRRVAKVELGALQMVAFSEERSYLDAEARRLVRACGETEAGFRHDLSAAEQAVRHAVFSAHLDKVFELARARTAASETALRATIELEQHFFHKELTSYIRLRASSLAESSLRRQAAHEEVDERASLHAEFENGRASVHMASLASVEQLSREIIASREAEAWRPVHDEASYIIFDLLQLAVVFSFMKREAAQRISTVYTEEQIARTILSVQAVRSLHCVERVVFCREAVGAGHLELKQEEASEYFSRQREELQARCAVSACDVDAAFEASLIGEVKVAEIEQRFDVLRKVLRDAEAHGRAMIALVAWVVAEELKRTLDAQRVRVRIVQQRVELTLTEKGPREAVVLDQATTHADLARAELRARGAVQLALLLGFEASHRETVIFTYMHDIYACALSACAEGETVARRAISCEEAGELGVLFEKRGVILRAFHAASRNMISLLERADRTAVAHIEQADRAQAALPAIARFARRAAAVTKTRKAARARALAQVHDEILERILHKNTAASTVQAFMRSRTSLLVRSARHAGVVRACAIAIQSWFRARRARGEAEARRRRRAFAWRRTPFAESAAAQAIQWAYRGHRAAVMARNHRAQQAADKARRAAATVVQKQARGCLSRAVASRRRVDKRQRSVLLLQAFCRSHLSLSLRRALRCTVVLQVHARALASARVALRRKRTLAAEAIQRLHRCAAARARLAAHRRSRSADIATQVLHSQAVVIQRVYRGGVGRCAARAARDDRRVELLAKEDRRRRQAALAVQRIGRGAALRAAARGGLAARGAAVLALQCFCRMAASRAAAFTRLWARAMEERCDIALTATLALQKAGRAAASRGGTRRAYQLDKDTRARRHSAGSSLLRAARACSARVGLARRLAVLCKAATLVQRYGCARVSKRVACGRIVAIVLHKREASAAAIQRAFRAHAGTRASAAYRVQAAWLARRRKLRLLAEIRGYKACVANVARHELRLRCSTGRLGVDAGEAAARRALETEFEAFEGIAVYRRLRHTIPLPRAVTGTLQKDEKQSRRAVEEGVCCGFRVLRAAQCDDARAARHREHERTRSELARTETVVRARAVRLHAAEARNVKLRQKRWLRHYFLSRLRHLRSTEAALRRSIADTALAGGLSLFAHSIPVDSPAPRPPAVDPQPSPLPNPNPALAVALRCQRRGLPRRFSADRKSQLLADSDLGAKVWDLRYPPFGASPASVPALAAYAIPLEREEAGKSPSLPPQSTKRADLPPLSISEQTGGVGKKTRLTVVDLDGLQRAVTADLLTRRRVAHCGGRLLGAEDALTLDMSGVWVCGGDGEEGSDRHRDYEIRPFFEAFSGAACVADLRLDGCGLRDTEVVALAIALRANGSLRTLSLCDNAKVTDVSAKELTHTVTRFNTTLRVVDLHNTGASAFARAELLHTLSSLYRVTAEGKAPLHPLPAAVAKEFASSCFLSGLRGEHPALPVDLSATYSGLAVSSRQAQYPGKLVPIDVWMKTASPVG